MWLSPTAGEGATGLPISGPPPPPTSGYAMATRMAVPTGGDLDAAAGQCSDNTSVAAAPTATTPEDNVAKSKWDTH